MYQYYAMKREEKSFSIEDGLYEDIWYKGLNF